MATKTTTTTSVDTLLATAIHRAEDSRTATIRLAQAVTSAAEPIGRASYESEIRVSVALPSDLDGEPDDRPRSYRLAARGTEGAIVVERRDALLAECNPRTPWTIWRAIWVDEPASDWDGWSQAVRTSGSESEFRPVPRHVLVAVAPRLAELASELAAKAEYLANETEAALAVVEARS